MTTFKRKPWTLTLLVPFVLAISFSSVVHAKDFEHRGHAVFKRMVKQRSPQEIPGLFGGAKDSPVGAAGDPAENPSAAAEPSGSASSTPPLLPPLVPSEVALPSISVPVPSLSQSAPSVSQSSVSVSSASTPSPSPIPVNQPPSQVQTSETKVPSTVVHYETEAPSQPSQPPKASGSTSAARVSLAVIVGIASAVGVIIIAWTIFRKWKLGRSKKFDQRLNPIDWQPPSADEDGGVPGARRHSVASSFHSGTGQRGYGSTTNQHGPLPDHDFTAGASLAPGGGYTDMSRGPSPQPQMMETNAYGANMYDHEQYRGVPLHQGYGGPNYYNGNRPY